MVDDTLRDGRVGKVGIGVEGLEGVVRIVFEFFCRGPLDLGVDVWR